MNLNPKPMMMTMTISRLQRMMLGAAVAIAVVITVVQLNRQQNSSPLFYKCFKTGRGWGYDIIFNNKIIIHQAAIPGIPGYTGFVTEQQAASIAQIVIEKIKSHQQPVITRQHLQQIGIIITQY